MPHPDHEYGWNAAADLMYALQRHARSVDELDSLIEGARDRLLAALDAAREDARYGVRYRRGPGSRAGAVRASERSIESQRYPHTPKPRPMLPARHSTRAFDVSLHGRNIDTVYYASTDAITAEEVKRSLVDHDHYNPAIVVKARR